MMNYFTLCVCKINIEKLKGVFRRRRGMMLVRVATSPPPCPLWGEPSPWTEGPLSQSWLWVFHLISFVKRHPLKVQPWQVVMHENMRHPNIFVEEMTSNWDQGVCVK